MDLVLVDDRARRHALRARRSTDMTVHAVMAGEALPQVVGGVEPAVFDPRSGLDGREPLFDQPAFLVPGDDADRVLLRGLTFGGQEQPVEPVPACWRHLLQDAHCEHGEWGRAQGGTRSTRPARSSSLMFLRPLRVRGPPQIDRLLRDDIQFGRVREQVPDLAVRRDGPPPARTAGADQKPLGAEAQASDRRDHMSPSRSQTGEFADRPARRTWRRRPSSVRFPRPPPPLPCPPHGSRHQG